MTVEKRISNDAEIYFYKQHWSYKPKARRKRQIDKYVDSKQQKSDLINLTKLFICTLALVFDDIVFIIKPSQWTYDVNKFIALNF